MFLNPENKNSGYVPYGTVKDPTCKWHSKFGILDPLRKAPKHTRLSPETDSEVALVNAYLGRRRARILSQWDLHHQIPNDNNSIALANEDSVSQASSWKESESEGRPTLASLHQRKIALRQQNLGSCQIRERPCLHCKAQRTREWLVRHFFQPEQKRKSSCGNSIYEVLIVCRALY
uniref:Uncharacterized protein n=1 Tax=Ornithorhynchus anatinus TaxID=9258 RepID=F6ZBY2_ORNAN